MSVPLDYFDKPEATTITTYAGFWRRAMAVVLDGFILLIPCLLLTALIAFPTISRMSSGQLSQAEEDTLSGICQVCYMVLAWLYHSTLESSRYGGSFGKLAMDIRVTDIHGAPITFGHASLRFLAAALSWLTCMAGFAIAGFTQRKQALHDLVVGTLVVSRQAASVAAPTPPTTVAPPPHFGGTSAYAGKQREIAERLRTLHELYEQGILTEEEFAAKKKQLLEQF